MKPEFRLVLSSFFLGAKRFNPGTEIIVKPDRNGLAVYLAKNRQFIGVATHEVVLSSTAIAIPQASLAQMEGLEFKVVPSKETGFDVALRNRQNKKARVVIGMPKTIAVQAKELLTQQFGGLACNP